MTTYFSAVSTFANCCTLRTAILRGFNRVLIEITVFFAIFHFLYFARQATFRYLPEDEAIFQNDDYNEIYTLQSSDTINKLRGVDGISLDKFELSKFLGKYLRIGGMIDDKKELRFEKDILKIFDLRTIIENYTAWEKVIEIFVINERYNSIEAFIKKIIEAIETIEYKNENSNIQCEEIKKALYLHLHSVICRTFALVWTDERLKIQRNIYSIKSVEDNIELKYDIHGNCDEYLSKVLISYCKTCMIDKAVIPTSINMLPVDIGKFTDKQINLTHFNDVLSIAKCKWKSEYKYFPYLVNMYDFCMISCVEELKKVKLTKDIKKENLPFEDLELIKNNNMERYIKSNYIINKDDENVNKLISVIKIDNLPKSYQVSVGNGKKSKLRLAIANVKLNHQNFKKLVKDMPNRSYERYKDLSVLVNQAIKQRADMLIMPESFIPFEWLPTLSRTCAKNNLAVVTGVEHIKYEDNIFNLTAVILPYKEENHKCADITFHLKTHYAPIEKEEIHGYRLNEVRGNHYELYKWNDCYFPVYCCYELASISDRAIFQSYADLLIAVEWNKDVNYYSNILESLSRDIHCYCVQVNTSDYGDSRITKPSKTEEKDIIRTKGGINHTILLDEIDIGLLREFQIKEYTLQKNDSKFKTTPPNFEPSIVMKKIRGDNLF